MTNTQVPIVLALIRNEDGKILLQLRHDDEYLAANNKWEFPGGKIKFGEKPDAAIRREVHEEIGCEIDIVRPIPLFWSNVWDHKDGHQGQAVLLGYECRIANGHPAPMEKDVVETGWYTPEEIYKMDCLPGIKELVRVVES